MNTNNKIIYSDTKDFKHKDLELLFVSVGWESSKYATKLIIAMKNSTKVFSAWDGDNLVGLINSISDNILVVFFPYLLIHPSYQKNGIGEALVNMMKEEYINYHTLSLFSDLTATKFYEKCGFSVIDAIPMSVKDLH